MEAKASIRPEVQLDTATAASAPVKLHISFSNRETAWPRVTVPEAYRFGEKGQDLLPNSAMSAASMVLGERISWLYQA